MGNAKEIKVVEAIWPWRRRKQPDASGLDPNTRRRRAITQALVMTGIGLLLFFLAKHKLMAQIVWSLAAVVLTSGFFLPRIFKGIEAFGAALGKGAAVGLTWGLLTPFFYLIFLPGRLILRLQGKDPLHTKWPSDETTYWIPHRPTASTKQYEKQH